MICSCSTQKVMGTEARDGQDGMRFNPKDTKMLRLESAPEIITSVQQSGRQQGEVNKPPMLCLHKLPATKHKIELPNKHKTKVTYPKVPLKQRLASQPNLPRPHSQR